MAKQQSKQSKDITSWKPGSEPEKAGDVAASRDFGVPEAEAPSHQRDYVSQNTKRSDRGATAPASWEHDGVRDHGAGADDNGPGSSSGGDMDTDILGVGTGGSGIAQSPPGAPPAADDTDGSTDDLSSKKPAGPRKEDARRAMKRSKGKQSSTDAASANLPNIAAGTEGADAATNSEARGDDSFASEISAGEARGDDAPMSPSSDSQGLPDTDETSRGG